MTNWPIALSTGCFYQRSFFDVIHEIQEAGFRHIEVCSFPRHLDYHNRDQVQQAGDLLHRSGVIPFSFHAPFADAIDITSFDERQRESSVQELITACESAALMGCANVVLHPGPERAETPPPEQFLQHMHHAAVSLNRVAAKCCELHVQLLLENMLPHLMFGPVRDMMYLLGEINTCIVGTCLDTGHAHLAREMGVVIQKLSGHLKMVHVNDNHGNWDAHLAPGDGSIDWPWVLGELMRSGFQGPLVLELSSGDGESMTSVLARAKRSREYLRGLYGTLGH
jgi:sugar phosphate isomerase/epimerase